MGDVTCAVMAGNCERLVLDFVVVRGFEVLTSDEHFPYVGFLTGEALVLPVRARVCTRARARAGVGRRRVIGYRRCGGGCCLSHDEQESKEKGNDGTVIDE